ncbi:MAG: BCCT family transporter [Firmicutes bacterium]|nr:BCCT family transporter [Bacillota bacterium]
METTNKSVRWAVFIVPWALAIITIILNFVNGDAFNSVIMTITGFILDKFSWLFALMAFVCVILIIAAYFSKFGGVRIGGRNAKPVMNMTNYVWIVLCTIMAAGILLWACAEPMYHYYGPPANITPESEEAIDFLMKNIFLEWTFTPMCIYGVPAILFAFLFYNAKKDYSLGNMLYPTLSYETAKKISPVVDVICLLALVCGMAASMGSAVFLVTGGMSTLTNGGVSSGALTWTVVGAVIVAAFVASAVSGVMKGIRILSTFNSRIYMALGLFVFLFGPTFYVLSLIVEGFGAYLTDFAAQSLFLSVRNGDHWADWWPVFYWCNWMAWMPVTSAFLGRISRGYTVREAIRVIVVFPALFSVFWLGLFSGSALYYELNGAGINEAMTNGGTEFATYAVFQQMPIPTITIAVFLLIVFVSFVTASDSNTNAMSGLCTSGLTAEDTESPTWLKIVWGVTIGAMCIIFINAFQTTDALKYLSNLGGFPVVFFLIIICISFVKVMMNPKKYDTFQEDYDEYGRPLPSERLLSEQEEMKQAKKAGAAPAEA